MASGAYGEDTYEEEDAYEEPWAEDDLEEPWAEDDLEEPEPRAEGWEPQYAGLDDWQPQPRAAASRRGLGAAASRRGPPLRVALGRGKNKKGEGKSAVGKNKNKKGKGKSASMTPLR